jgi:hypothetical protein
MLGAALAYLRATADLSTEMTDRYGYSAEVLRLLAFEVLLKAVLVLERGEFYRSHSYKDQWGSLSQTTKDELNRLAVYRWPGEGEYFTETNLMGLERAFLTCRYHYEPNLGRTPEEARQVGEDWVARGASLEEAEIRGYGQELVPMNFALSQFLARKLGRTIEDIHQIG